MKLLIILIVVAGLLLLPMTGFSQAIYGGTAVPLAEQNTTDLNPPPVAQPLVREGDFAVKLAEALEVGTPESGSAAESMLAFVGIAPPNGWIADYPVTPEIVGQLQSSIQAAVDSGKLEMSTDEAMAALQTVSDDFGLSLVVAGPGSNDTAGEPAPGSSAYTSPEIVDGYYSDYGPPVITYYSPPPDYLYLYSWVPSPFWCAGLYYPGFFILNDFDTVVVVHHRREICTNHVFDHRTREYFLIDPVSGRHYRSVEEFPHFNRREAGNGAGAIDHHSWAGSRNDEDETMSPAFAGRNPMSSGSAERFRGPAPSGTDSTVRQPMNRAYEGRHFSSGRINQGNRDQGEFIRPPLSSERSYRRPSSMESHGRIGNFGNQGSFRDFHRGRFAAIPNDGVEHRGFAGAFHGDRFAGNRDNGMGHDGFGAGFHGGHFATIPSGGMEHRGFAGGFHRGRFAGTHNSGMGHAGGFGRR
jgi:hypothetical protein